VVDDFAVDVLALAEQFGLGLQVLGVRRVLLTDPQTKIGSVLVSMQRKWFDQVLLTSFISIKLNDISLTKSESESF